MKTAALALLLPSVAFAQSCEPQWDPNFTILTGGLSNRVGALAVADLGQGPRLIAAGNFTSPSPLSRVAAWDGQSWSALGAGPTSISCLTTFDDGTGRKLYAGTGGAVFIFNGSSWSTLGSYAGMCSTLIEFDLDGPGPQPPSLIAAGSSVATNSVVSRWNGTAWENLANAPTPGSNAVGYALAVHDADGPGPAAPALYLAGHTLNAQRCVVMKLEGDAWIPQVTAPSFFGDATTFATLDTPSGPALHVAGNFDFGRLAIHRLTATGWENALAVTGPQIGAPFPSDVSHSWMVPILDQDGPALALFPPGLTNALLLRNGTLTPWGIGINQQTTLPVFVLPVQDAQGSSLFIGGVFASVTASGGETTSNNIARLRLCERITSCSPDFNQDGDFGTDQDIEAFFACLAGNCCQRCLSSDFNNDGDSGTDQDIEAFFRVLAGGSC